MVSPIRQYADESLQSLYELVRRRSQYLDRDNAARDSQDNIASAVPDKGRSPEPHDGGIAAKPHATREGRAPQGPEGPLPFLGPRLVFARFGVDPNHVAFFDEGRDLDHDAGLERGGLGLIGGRRALDRGHGLRDRQVHGLR